MGRMTVCVLAAGMSLMASAQVYDVRTFGAAGDGKTKDTAAIQKAIDAAAAAGGGEVLLPAGTYLSGSLFFKSHVDFHLAQGATLKGGRRAARRTATTYPADISSSP